MRPRLTIVTLVLGATVVLTPAHGAEAAAARCHGERATIVGTARADRLVGTTGPDVILGRGGADTIIGLSGDDLLCGGSGDDTIVAGNGRDIVDGGRGNDRLKGQKGMDTFLADGRRGDDGDDLYVGGPDKDRFHLMAPGRDTLRGGAGHDQVNLFGDVRGLRASGGVGNDRFRVHSDQDITLAGGLGRDRIVVTGYAASADQRLTVDYRVGKIIDTYADSVVTVSSIEVTEIRVPDLEHTLAAYFYGTGGDDEISVHGGSLAPLVAFGYRGDDVFLGSATGDDTMDGGAGTDRADGDEGHDTCLSIERATSCESER